MTAVDTPVLFRPSSPLSRSGAARPHLRRMHLGHGGVPHPAPRHPDPRRYALVTLFCYGHMRNLTDHRAAAQLVHKMGTQAEKRVDEELDGFQTSPARLRLLFQMARVLRKPSKR